MSVCSTVSTLDTIIKPAYSLVGRLQVIYAASWFCITISESAPAPNMDPVPVLVLSSALFVSAALEGFRKTKCGH